MIERIINLQTKREFIIDLKNATGENAMPCPECSGDRKKKTAKSFSWDGQKGIGNCLHCGAKFGKKLEGTYKPNELQKPIYSRPEWRNITDLEDDVLKFFTDRGLSQRVVNQVKITQGRTFFPQLEKEAKCIEFNYFRDTELINVKYRGPKKSFKLYKDAELIFYNLDSMKDMDYVIITEGECFHPSAEVLTDIGWVSFENLKPHLDMNAKVAQYKDGVIEFVKPLAFVEKEFNGELIEMKNNQRFYSLTTPEHNMVYEDRNGNLIKRKYHEASAALNIPRVGDHDGPGIELSNDEIRLAIAVSADFTMRRSGDIYGCLKKERKVLRMKEILDSLKIEYSCNLDNRGYHSFFIKRSNAPKYLFKEFPHDWIYQSTIHQKDLIINEILYWDGNSVPNRNQIEYSSNLYENAVFIQTIAHLTGYCSTIINRSNKFGSWYKVSILFNKRATSNQSLKKSITKVPYKGLVNCVQVPSGMLIVRQNGCISISGNCDALSYIEAGYDSVISVPNGATKSAQQKLVYLDNCIDLFEEVKTIFIATDDDEPGRVLQEELARRLGKYRCRKVSFLGCKDANELLMKEPLALQDTITQSEPYPIDGVLTVDNLSDDIWRLKREGLKPGCDISIPCFNELLTFDPGYLTVVTGIPNHGKSEFLDQIMVDLSIKHGWRFGIFSPENYPLQLHFSKIASKLVGERFNDMADHKVIQAMDYYRDNFFYIVPKEDNSVESIIEHATQLVKRYGINGLIIDAWNKLDHDFASNETTYIGKQLDLIINFAHKFGVHIFVVAHPTKMQRDKGNGPYLVPTLYDMAGSAHFFNKSHNGISVYRHFFEDGTSSPEVFVQKVKFKHWGRQGSVALQYDIDSGRFYQPSNKQSGNYLEQKASQEEMPFEI